MSGEAGDAPGLDPALNRAPPGRSRWGRRSPGRFDGGLGSDRGGPSYAALDLGTNNCRLLVARPSGSKDRNNVVMAVIPGDQELDLKALAAAAGEKNIQLVPVKELQGLTGYIRGGVTALAAKREFPVFVDETMELFDVISISAGMRGLQILLAPADYLRATKGTIAALGQPKKHDLS